MSSYNYFSGDHIRKPRNEPPQQNEEEIKKRKKLIQIYLDIFEKQKITDEEIFGPQQEEVQINRNLLIEKTNLIGPCKVYGFVTTKDIRTNEITFIKKEMEEEENGENAVATLNMWIRNTLAHPDIEKLYRNLFSTKYMVEYREKLGRHFLKISFEKSGKDGKVRQEFFIREK